LLFFVWVFIMWKDLVLLLHWLFLFWVFGWVRFCLICTGLLLLLVLAGYVIFIWIHTYKSLTIKP
jgi:hypothetical protein